jgi:hypothetical protein
MQWIRSRLSFANLVSLMALFVALGGTTYAAVTLPNDSVGIKQIKKNAVGGSEIRKNAVRSGEVRNGSLRRSDFAAGQLPAGAKGDKGDKGDQGIQGVQGVPGEDGVALDAFARVDLNAARTLEPNDAGQAPQNKGIVQADVVPGEGGAATGTTCFNLPSRPASAMVVVDNADAGANVDQIATVAIDRGEDLGDCPATHNDARVRIIDTDLTAGGPEQDPGPANARFFIWFEL